MDESVLIRRTSRSDGEIIRKLRVLALTDAPYAFGARLDDVLLEPNEKFEMDAVRHSESNKSTSFIAFDNEIPVGMIGAFFEPPSQQAFICSLWVEPDFRSRFLAKNLLNAATTWLEGSGAKAFYAWVADSNFRAIAFYKKYGFIKTGKSRALPSNLQELEHLYIYELSSS